MSEQGPSEQACWIRAALERFEGSLLRYTASITGRRETAREVVQDTFFKLCQQRPAELDGRLAEWLYTVARNGALDVRRKEKRMKSLTIEQAERHVDPRTDVAHDSESQDEFRMVERLLAGMSDNQREVIRLKFQSDLSYKEIAAITGLTVTNVGYLLHTALKELRREMSSSPDAPSRDA